MKSIANSASIKEITDSNMFTIILIIGIFGNIFSGNLFKMGKNK